MDRALELSPEKLLVLYDGVCALCNGIVRFLLARDRRDQYRFAPLQSDLGREIVRRHGGDPDQLSSLYVILDPGTGQERALLRGRAAIVAIARLGRGWKVAHLLRILPGFVLDLGYRLVARYRYRVFGRYETCPLPEPEQRHKFIATA